MNTMYFGIIGDRQELAKQGLHFVHAQDIKYYGRNIITFYSNYPERFKQCAALIKRGSIEDITTLKNKTLPDTVGVANKTLGVKLKQQLPQIKRFKLVELIHTDKEIKDKGMEIIDLGNGRYGRVQGYQNIHLYEQIDFHKPMGGMSIGMMPSKLALTLINIAIGHHEQYTHRTETWTVWDPFCGFGTTNMLANSLGYHTIGTDLNPTQAKQNRKWRQQQDGATQTTKSFISKHDVTNPFNNPILRHAELIVSEGRLGHIVTQKTAHNEIIGYSQAVAQVYRTCMTNIQSLMQSSPSPKTVVITIPLWLKHEISINEDLLSHVQGLGRHAEILNQPYSRKQQLVGRSIMIAHLPTTT